MNIKNYFFKLTKLLYLICLNFNVKNFLKLNRIKFYRIFIFIKIEFNWVSLYFGLIKLKHILKKGLRCIKVYIFDYFSSVDVIIPSLILTKNQWGRMISSLNEVLIPFSKCWLQNSPNSVWYNESNFPLHGICMNMFFFKYISFIPIVFQTVAFSYVFSNRYNNS